MKRNLKRIASVAIIALTIAAFWYYIAKHPDILHQLRHMPAGTVAVLLVCYAIVFLALVLITRVSLRMYDKHMGKQENLLFNAYSTLVNSFGPGQSGPIFRGAYLKKRHNLGIKQFVFTTLLYYGFYAVISAMFVCIGTRPWWQTVLVMVGVGAVSIVVIRWYAQKKARLGEQPSINALTLAGLFGATTLQLVMQAIIYGIELHAIGTPASAGDVLAYTGVANFALFVSITPGAIGIREAFLLFSQNLYHIDSSAIVTASLLDRATYLIFLGLLFVMVLSLHAKDKLHIKQLRLSTDGEPPKS